MVVNNLLKIQHTTKNLLGSKIRSSSEAYEFICSNCKFIECCDLLYIILIQNETVVGYGNLLKSFTFDYEAGLYYNGIINNDRASGFILPFCLLNDATGFYLALNRETESKLGLDAHYLINELEETTKTHSVEMLDVISIASTPYVSIKNIYKS